MIEVFMLVATLMMPTGPSRVVSADWPYFTTMQECQQVVASLRNIPPNVDTVMCEARWLDPSTGRVMRAK